ncbi:hypothetical protein IE81DRAFT_74715 [Ceraceosorus guamensis]|uniref:Uncharacterized protein n=1 Tax=Ceraceosorus guamensis TaxID=1522189 RepID=A0A316VMI5_9BASI|nr:hypothetical protein IE81DRAFT_74715 [Ceraceosorus guamensis]PWN38792.1 hypothetical protein IE81DRAFT_74715 [Ceraceosorus guamensis]
MTCITRRPPHSPTICCPRRTRDDLHNSTAAATFFNDLLPSAYSRVLASFRGPPEHCGCWHTHRSARLKLSAACSISRMTTLAFIQDEPPLKPQYTPYFGPHVRTHTTQLTRVPITSRMDEGSLRNAGNMLYADDGKLPKTPGKLWRQSRCEIVQRQTRVRRVGSVRVASRSRVPRARGRGAVRCAPTPLSDSRF